MLLWHMMREAAIFRHRVLWSLVGDDWESHMELIRAVYGY